MARFTPNLSSNIFNINANTCVVDEVVDIILSDNYPQLLQKVNMQMLQQYLPLPLLPQVLHLDINSQTALQPHWQPVNITPEKHYGYALQWFGLSLTLCTLFLFRIYKHYKSSPKVAGGE